jgi:5-methylcytosine-specific restriction endonuclease McrA
VSQPFQTSKNPAFQRLWEDQLGQCALCQKPMLRNRFEAPHARIWQKLRATVDHIMPKSKGGSDAAQNLQLAHAHSNKIKGNKT